MATDHPEGSDSNELAVLSSGMVPDEESQIGEELGTNLQTGIQLPDVSHERDPSSRISRDESDLLWKDWEDLKTETGFRSYDDYLDAHGGKHAYLWSLRHAFRDMAVDTDLYSYSCAIVDIVDVLERDSTCRKLTLRYYSTSGTKILSALRRPPPGVTVGIVLWNSTSLNQEMLNALGLGLKIQPNFFKAFLVRHPETPAVPEKATSWKIADDVVVVGHYVMTLVRNYLPTNPDAPPIVLIAGLDQRHLGLYEEFSVSNEKLPFQKLDTPAIRGMTGGLTDPVDRLPEWMRDCVRRLESDIKNGKGLGASDMDLSLNSLTALLQCTMPLFRKECRVTRERYLKATRPTRTETVETVRKEIFKMRYSLRRMVEDFEDSSLRLRDCMHSPMKKDTPQGQSLMTLEGDLQQFRLEATRLETEIRDYLQLQIGELALQESKKSIELSNSQIEEAKRVKIFTILAFVYVPLNLATSIFGMNIEQLNGSGQHVSVFIITAVAALAVIGGSWFAIEQTTLYRKWQKRSPDTTYSGKTQFALVVRLAMIAYLIWNGHSRWMLRSGVWWRILTNHRSRIITRRSQGEDQAYRNEILTAGGYVSKYSTKGQGTYSRGRFARGVDVLWIKVEQE